MRSVVVVLPASMWAMMPMLRVRSSGNSRLAISLLLSLVCFSASGGRKAKLAVSTVFNAIGGGPPFARPSTRLAHRRAEVTGMFAGGRLQLHVTDLLGVHGHLHPRTNVVRLKSQGLVDRRLHAAVIVHVELGHCQLVPGCRDVRLRFGQAPSRRLPGSAFTDDLWPEGVHHEDVDHERIVAEPRGSRANRGRIPLVDGVAES